MEKYRLDYSNYNGIEISEQNVIKEEKKSSYLQSLSQTFDNYIHLRRKGLIVNKKNQKFVSSHHSIKYYRQRTGIYRFLQKPTNIYGRIYHIFVSILILFCMIMTILSTFQDISVVLNEILFSFDVFFLSIISIEFILLLWASECMSQYRGLRGKVRFFLSPFRVIDIVVIITSIIIVAFSSHNNNLLDPSLQWIRFFQTFKMIRLEHRFRPWRVMASVLWDQREHLYITMYTSFLALTLISFLIYFAENGSNPDFNNLGQSLWWGVITLTTVGYGDIYPNTTAGKVLAAIAIIFGVSIFALPAGILGTGLALKVEGQQKKRQKCKRLIPAAKLIQSIWRYHYLISNSETISGQKSLRTTQMNCLKFILKTKYFVCRHHFEEALKPYDVKDVLEQYSAGHIEMLARVKHINHKINIVESTAQSTLRAQHEFKSLINYRLVKLEEFMTESASKLDQLLKIELNNQILYENIISVFESNFKSKETYA